MDDIEYIKVSPDEMNENIIDWKLSEITDLERLKSIRKWKYPLEVGTQILFVKKGEEPVGSYAFTGGRIFGYEDKEFLTAQSIDTIVSPTARGQGIFTKMGKVSLDCLKDKVKFVYGITSIKGGAYKGFTQRIGWQDVGPINQYLFIIKPYPTFINQGFNRVISMIISPLLKIRNYLKLRLSRLNRSNFVVTQKGNINLIAELWDTNPRDKLFIKRSPEYIKMRYLEHPENIYRLNFAIKDNKQFGYIIFSDSPEIGNILEMKSENDDPEVIKSLILSTIDIFQNSNNPPSFVRYWGDPDDPYKDVLQSMGFISRRSDQRIIIYDFSSNLSFTEFQNYQYSLGDFDHA